MQSFTPTTDVAGSRLKDRNRRGSPPEVLPRRRTCGAARGPNARGGCGLLAVHRTAGTTVSGIRRRVERARRRGGSRLRGLCGDLGGGLTLHVVQDRVGLPV